MRIATAVGVEVQIDRPNVGVSLSQRRIVK